MGRSWEALTPSPIQFLPRTDKGIYGGGIVEEPEYEGMVAFTALVGIDDVTTTVVLANEAGWVIAWVMECLEKGILGKKTDPLALDFPGTWEGTHMIG